MLALFLTSLAFVGSPVFSLSMKMSIKAEWIEIKPASVIVPKRSGHVAFHVQERNFVFGGYAEDDDMNRYVTNDLWEWKDKGWTEQTQSQQVPGPRLVSAAVVLNGRYVPRTHSCCREKDKW
jgi:N-acetylneuraminic acid mutarotase